MVRFRVCIGFLDGILHFNHGCPPFRSEIRSQRSEIRIIVWLLHPRSSIINLLSSTYPLFSRRSFFRLNQSSVGAVAVRMIFGLPAAADGDGLGLLKLQNKRLHVGDFVRTIAKREILTAGATAVGHAF